MTCSDFVQRISNFEELSASAQIDYLAYYHLIILKQNEVKSRDIQKYFEELHIPEYSNIPAYLSKFTKRGRSQKFLKSSSGYKLATTRKKEIDEEAGNKPMPKPTDDLFPIEILDNTRQYLVKVAEQACICYDLGLYDASLVMVRKLVEALIIECFRKHGKEAEIKGSDGHYFFLSKLVDKYLNQNYWPVNRNTGKALPLIKNLGDLSAHNIRFSAKKPDLDKIKHDLRVVIEDIVLLIDYPNWK